MFIRKKKSSNSVKRTVEIVKNERISGKVRQNIVAYIGIIKEPEDEERIMALAKIKLLELIKQESAKQNKLLTDNEATELMRRGRKKKNLLPKSTGLENSVTVLLENLTEEYRLVDGLNDIGGSAFNNFGLSELLRTDKQNTLLKRIVLARMGYPQSKLKLCDTMRLKMNQHYTEDQMYRLMDNIYPKIDVIKRKIFSHTQSLMPSVNVLLFDVTTLYCESTIQDELRNFGFSKDGKFNNTQLVLALATNERGLPIGYEVFAGNSAEVNTLLFAIQKWHRFLPTRKVCFIGDRAMFSEDNLSLMESHGYDYIIAAKLRSQPIALQKKILDKSIYQTTQFNDEVGRIAEFDLTCQNPTIRCNINEQSLGYTVTMIEGKITSIHYQSPCGIHLTSDDRILEAIKDELHQLKRYTSACPCILMTQEEYSLKGEKIQNNSIIFRESVEILLIKPQKELQPYTLYVYMNQSGELQYSTITPDGEIVTEVALVCPAGITTNLIDQLNNQSTIHISFEARQAILAATYKNGHTKEDNLIYKNIVASCATLDKKNISKLARGLTKGKMPVSLMRLLFKDIYIEKSHINIPEQLIVTLFPHHRPLYRRLCVSYKPSRAANDAYKRQKILSRLSSKEGAVNKVIKTVAKMYMKTNGDASIDHLKIAIDEQWDGIHGIITNIQGEIAQNLLMHYSQLWRIEESFRINKNQLSVRPIYHYKPERIHAHLVICYLAFALLRLIEYQTELTQKHLSIDRILAALLSVESSIYYDSTTQKRYKMPGAMSDDAKVLYKAFGIKVPEKPTVYKLAQFQ